MNPIVTEATIVDQNDNINIFQYIPKYDEIYNYIDDPDITSENHPYGVALCSSILNAKDYNNSLFSPYAINPSSGVYGKKSFTKKNVLEFPMFVVLDKNRKPIPARDIKLKSYFSDKVRRFNDIPECFRIKNGVYQPVSNYRLLHRHIEEILTASYSCDSKNVVPNLFDFKIKFSFKERYVHFLNDEEIEYQYRTGALSEYLNKYAFLYVDDDLEFLFDENLMEAMNHHDAYVEPVLIEDDDDNIAVLSSYILLFSDQYAYTSFMHDIKYEGEFIPRVISFSSSAAPDSFTKFLNSIESLVEENDIRIEVVMREGKVENTYTPPEPICVHLSELVDNTAFVAENLKNETFRPVRLVHSISGLGIVEFDSTNVFYTDAAFFNLLKIKSPKDRKRIRKITIDKFLMDTHSNNHHELASINLGSDIFKQVYFGDDKLW